MSLLQSHVQKCLTIYHTLRRRFLVTAICTHDKDTVSKYFGLYSLQDFYKLRVLPVLLISVSLIISHVKISTHPAPCS